MGDGVVALVHTVAFSGIDVCPVEVQVQIANGLPAFAVVGLPDKAVAESRERVRAALVAIGLGLPPKRITVNLAPADVLKEGSHFDLPIALGILAAMDLVPREEILGYTVMGELALDGRISAVNGVLPAAISAHAHERGLICPSAQGSEAAWAGGGDTFAVADLLQAIGFLKGEALLAPARPGDPPPAAPRPDMADVKGQESARRALEIAAAGGHNLLMTGRITSYNVCYTKLLRRVRPPRGSGAGEIDLVARRGGTVAFVEIKARPSEGAGLFAIDPHQQRRLLRAAEWFIKSHPELSGCDLRFDAVVVCPGRWPRHLPDAWRVDA